MLKYECMFVVRYHRTRKGEEREREDEKGGREGERG
jgi:hypothetical protein